MENTIGKRRAEDTDLNAGNKRSKQADGQPPPEEIQPTNELEMEALRPAGVKMNPYSDYAVGSTVRPPYLNRI